MTENNNRLDQTHHAGQVLQTSAPETQLPTTLTGPAFQPTPPALQVVEQDLDPHRLARYYLKHHSTTSTGDPTIHFYRGEWWRWDGTRYLTLADKSLNIELTNACKDCVDREHLCDSKGFLRPVRTQLITNVRGALAGLVYIPDSVDMPMWLDPKPRQSDLMAFKNGLLSLDALLGGERPVSVQSHTPKWFSPVVFPFDYEKDAKCERFLRFLGEVFEGDEERIAFMQEWFGYCLIPDTRQHTFVILVGDGGNGKSVLLNVLTGLLGPDNVSNLPLDELTKRFQMASTLGKLANISAETSKHLRLNEGVLKGFVAGDRMHCDRKFLSPIQALPTARVMVGCNELPIFEDLTDAIYRRLVLVPFNRTFAKWEKNKRLTAELLRELPGIFNWAVLGLRRLREVDDFTEPATCLQAKEELRCEANPAREFLLEYYVESSGQSVKSYEVYQAYHDWCLTTHKRPLKHAQFGREVSATFRGVTKTRPQTDGARWYEYQGLDVRLRSMREKAS